MTSGTADDRGHLAALDRAITARGRDLALFLAYDGPSLVEERPGLKRAYFAERAVSDEQLAQTVETFRAIGAYVEIFLDERELIQALGSGRLDAVSRPLNVLYNGLESGVAPGGFEPGRKALVPALADAYGLACAHSTAYACALALHKFHAFTALSAAGVNAPAVWHYRLGRGWLGAPPPDGIRVITKSTYEAWSVGVGEDSVFTVDSTCEERVATTAERIGQPVTVQQFVAGAEVYVPILTCPAPVVTPPVEVVLAKAPGDPTAVMTMEDNVRADGVRYQPYHAAAAVHDRLATQALAAFDALQLRGFGRVDFRVDAAGTPWVIDVACSPGMSRAGASFSSLGSWGFDHAAFLRIVIAATLATRDMLGPLSATTPPPAS